VRWEFFISFASRLVCTVWCGYCGVINRTGTGELPDTVGVDVAAVLLQPATFSTVTLTLPFASTALMNTCKNPTIVTGGLLPVSGPGISAIGSVTMLLLDVRGVPDVTAALFGPALEGAEEAVSSQSWPGSRIIHRVAVAVSPKVWPGSKVRSACTPPPTMPQAYIAVIMWRDLAVVRIIGVVVWFLTALLFYYSKR
jgi:hypothetical protein